MGESCIHLWIEKLRDYLRTKYHDVAELVTFNDVVIEEKEPEKKIPVFDVAGFSEKCPQIISADPFSERKSTFQGHAATVTNNEQIKYKN